MSHKEGENLPSVNDFLENQEDLPSLESFKEENLPSLEEFVTTPKEEDSVTIEDANGESFLEVIDVVKAPEWQELVRLVNDVRKDIPEIPEIKYYDEELEQLGQKIREIQDNVSFFDQKSSKIGDLDSNISEIWEKLPEIESKIPEIPEIKYYEGDIEYIYKKIDLLKEEIATLPEVKYYENDLEELKSKINDVKESIPTFPDWVNKVEEVPDFSWIGKTFSVIDDDFNKVQGHLDLIKEKIDLRVSELNETIETKDFELKVDVKNIIENHQEVKKNIYNELKETSLRVWEHHKEFKDDDRKLKKAILSEQNNLKQSLEKEIKRINQESVDTDETLLKFFTELKEEVNNLPQVKYYEDDIEEIRRDVKDAIKGINDLNAELHVLRNTIKEEQKQLSEQYLLNEPPGEKETAGGQTDPLTPMDQKFATLDDLSNHYRLFINRITTQLATMGGGGAGFIKDLDDVDISGLEDGYILQYEASTSKWKTVENAGTGVGGTWFSNDVGVSTTRIVGINTTTAKTGKSLFVVGDVEFDGNLSVAGTITKHDIINLDSIGIVTARSGIHISSNGLESSGISTFNTGVGTIHIGVGNTTLLVDGDARVTGILTVGSGSITLNPNTKQVTGIDEIIVGSGASISLAPLFTSRGTFSIDYSSLTLKGFDSQLDGTYNRQSEYFVLDTAPSASGSARFSQRSDHYYFLHESDNSKIIIYNTVDNFWVAIYSSGSNFSSPSNGQVVNPVSVSQFVTPIREDYDDSGRASPSSGFGIEYKTVVTDHTSSLGIATASSLEVTGIATVNSLEVSGITTVASSSLGVATATSLEVTGIATVSTAFYMPQYTTSARDAATFAEGAMIYNTTTKKMEFYNGTSWQSLPGMSLGLTVALDG